MRHTIASTQISRPHCRRTGGSGTKNRVVSLSPDVDAYVARLAVRRGMSVSFLMEQLLLEHQIMNEKDHERSSFHERFEKEMKPVRRHLSQRSSLQHAAGHA